MIDVLKKTQSIFVAVLALYSLLSAIKSFVDKNILSAIIACLIFISCITNIIWKYYKYKNNKDR